MNLKQVLQGTIGVLCGVALTVPLAGCGAGGASSDAIEVWTSMDTGSAQLKTLQSLTDKFMQENPGTKINLVPRATTYEEDIKVRLAANNAPDIFATHGWSRDRYAKFLEDLSGHEWADKLVDAASDSMQEENGSLYALPFGINVSAALYNKTVLDKAGVDPTQIATWDDFMNACEKVKAIGATCVGLPGKDNWQSGGLADMSAVGFYDDAKREELKNGTFNVDDYVPVMQNLKRLADSGYINVDYVSASPDDLYRLMAQDQMAFSFQGVNFLASLVSYNENPNVGLMPYPSPEGEPYFTGGELTAFGVSKSSKHKEAALKYIDFLAETDNMKEMVKVVAQPSPFTDVPSNLGNVTESYDYWTKERGIQTEAIFDRAYLPDGIWNTIITTADGVITGQLTPQAASEQMKTKYDSLYKK